MRKIRNLWLPHGKDWLEENFTVVWTEPQEHFVHEHWEQNEEWVLQCHPEKAWLILLREYLLGAKPDTQQRLRKLIPILARFGGTEQMVAALSLLSLMMLENGGWQPEVAAICMQVQREAVEQESAASVLRRFLFAQTAVVQGRLSEANSLYNELLEQKLGTDGIANGVMGRVLEKLGVYLLREATHLLAIRWELAARQWCHRYAASPLAGRLQQLMAKEMDAPVSPVHPIVAWHRLQKGLEWQGMCACSQTVYTDKETELVTLLLTARASQGEMEIEKYKYAATAYGDPYWVQQVVAVEKHEKPEKLEKPPLSKRTKQQPAYSYTFFEAFQGYTDQEEPLFPPSYRRKKVKQLLAMLLLQPQYSMVKEVIFEQLCRHDSGNQVENYLHVLIFRLRKLLGDQSGMPSDWVYIQDGMVRLNSDRIAGVDVQDYRQLAASGHQLWITDRPAALVHYEKARRMYRAVIAPELEYEEWIGELRNELLQQQKKMLNRLWDAARERNQPDQALFYGEELLAVDKWDLATVQQLCRDWLTIGEKQKIVDICKRYAEMLLADEEPIPAWMELVLEDAR